jgi:integrase
MTMARGRERLTDRQCRTAKPKGTITQGPNAGKARDSLLLADGGCLYLQVTTGADGNIRRSWLFRYQRSMGERTREMGLGSLADVGLAEAREKARRYRNMLKEGDDPIRVRDADRARKIADSAVVMTFQKAAETYIAQHLSSWKNPAHAAQWPSTLSTYVYPVIGKMSVADIDTPHIRKVLDPIWTIKPDTANRVRGRIEAILGWATVGKFRKGDNPARWNGHLENALPKPSKVRKRKHQVALPYADVPSFMAELRARNGIGALALEFTVLTAVRTADTRNARWDHINHAERRWDIPAFSKTNLPQRVPLSDAAWAVIGKMREIIDTIGGAVGKSEFIFPNDLTGAKLSGAAMLSVVERMNRKGTVTTHGFRASFRTWAQEQTNFPREVCEMSLGHKVGEDVERAYARGDALMKRIALMQEWANHCARPSEPGKVIPLQQRAAAE